jgi:hypothetical protein
MNTGNAISIDTYRKLRDRLVQHCQDALDVVCVATQRPEKSGSATSVIAIDRSLTQEIEAISRKTRECQFEIVLVSSFQCGKSTTFNALSGGRTISPTGHGLKTSGCIVKVQNLADPTASEYAEVMWRDDAELVAGFDTLRFRGQLLSLAPQRFDREELPATLEIIKLSDNTDRELIRGAAEAEIKRHGDDPGSYDPDHEGHLDVARIALLTTRFHSTEEWRVLTAPRRWAPDSIARLVTFPDEWEPRWQEGGINAVFGLNEVSFLFVREIRVHVHSATLQRMGAVVIDSPGLFASRWDTDVAQRAMKTSDVVLYLLSGYKAVEQSDLAAFRELRDIGQLHKLVLAQNMRTDRKSSERIRMTNAAQLTSQGVKTRPEDIVLFHARDALLTRKAENWLSTAHGDPAEEQAIGKTLWLSALQRDVSAGNEEAPEMPKRLTAEMIRRELEFSGLPALEERLARLVLEKNARFILVDNGAGALERLLSEVDRVLMAAEEAATTKASDCNREWTEATRRLDEFEKDCGDIIAKLDNPTIDSELAKEWANRLSSRADRISEEAGKAIAGGLQWKVVLDMSRFKTLLSDIVAEVVFKHVKSSLVEWATDLQDENIEAFTRYRREIIDAANERIREKWETAGTGFTPFERIPWPKVPTRFNEASLATRDMMDKNTSILDFIAGLGNVVRSLADVVLELLPFTAHMSTVGNWTKRLREPMKECLARIGSQAREKNEALQYMARVRGAYRDAFKEAITRPRCMFEQRCDVQRHALAMQTGDLKALVAHALMVRRERLHPLRERVAGFRRECEKELPA